MKTLKLTEEQVLKLYKTASPEFKQICEDTFGKEFFEQDLTEALNDWNDILKYSNKKESDVIPWKGKDLTKSQISQNAQSKLELIISIYNEGWIPNMTNLSEYKWMFYKYLSGGWLLVASLSWRYIYLYFPVGLYMKNQKICNSIIKNFPKLIDEYLGY